MIRTTIMLLAFALATFASQVQAQNSVNVRIQDITTLGSDKETIFLGRGLVTGLAGTGDSKSKETTQMAYDFAMATITRKDAKP
ncbi:MAG: flagellar basal body P-ring protein FlgI, partial [Planctomycetes bacterium]|nr:flagellar basal body P-ring protein FlgI [Planctomycetota bacterium]